jgi:hypothetical protein
MKGFDGSSEPSLLAFRNSKLPQSADHAIT